MEWDVEMALDPNDTENTGMKVRSNGLNDELSLVKYIFSDKTGTLTQNQMLFKKCSIAGVAYSNAAEGELLQELQARQTTSTPRMRSLYFLIYLRHP